MSLVRSILFERLGVKSPPGVILGPVGTIAATERRAPTAFTGDVLRCPCSASTTQQQSSNVAHWCYVGFVPAGTVIRYVRVAISTNAVGTQAAEVAVATSTTGPANGAALTLTKVWADGTLGDMTTGSVPRLIGNSTANTTPIPRDAHVFVGLRTAFTGGGATQPIFHILQRDWGDGFLCQTSSAGVLTSGTSWTATPVVIGNSTSTDIRGYL